MSSINPVTLFGIRHHGPGSAHSLVQALTRLRPDAVLVEGPPEAEELLPWLQNPALQPPVALLLYVPDQPKRAVYYPFAAFSPEWQALQYGLAHGCVLRFMDLPQAYQLAAEEVEALLPAAADPAPLPLIRDPLAWLAETAGYADSEHWWEHLIEQRRAADGSVFAAIQELITGLRAEVEQSAPGVFFPASRFEAQREAHMRQIIRETAAQGCQRIAVVCGAWHTPALADLSAPQADAKLLKGLAKVKVAAAWVPWSYGRLAWESGYGAGIESPGWYEVLWQAAQAGLPPGAVTIHWLTRVAQLLRAEDLSASSAHVIEAVRLAETLAALRGRPLPGLAEMNEAVRAVFCFGDDLPLRLIRQKLSVGERLGQVPEDAPMTPLQADLTQQQKSLRLPPEAAQRDLDLDLRQPTHLGRSCLLHRLNLLNIPWGVVQGVSGKSGTFHELWRLQWRPELAVSVVEAGLWGNTVADAAVAFIRHALEQPEMDLPTLTARLNQALLADLPAAVAALMTRLEAEAALASDTGQLMDALPALAEALRYGSVRQTDTAMIDQVVSGLVARICIGLPAACSSLNAEAAAEMLTRLNRVHSALGLLQNAAYQQSWRDTLVALTNQAGLHGLLAGRACAILLDQGSYTPAETSRRLGLALSTANEPAQAADWVEGLLKDSGTLLIHEDALWQVLDAWVTALPGAIFPPLLPLLRRTFSTFSAPERRLLGERAKQGSLARVRPSASPADFDEARAEAVLPLLAALLGLSEKAASAPPPAGGE